MHRVTIVGIGMNGTSTLTEEAKNAVFSSDMLVGAERMLKTFESFGKKTVSEYRSAEIVRVIKDNPDLQICVLMSGDSGFFSGTYKLINALNESNIEYDVLCGISSVSYFSSKIGKQWNEMKIVSLHGLRGNIVRSVARNRLTFFLLGGEITPSDICRRLCEFSMSDTVVYIGKNLGYHDEIIEKGTALEYKDTAISGLCVMVVENKHPETVVMSGIADEEFLRGKVPMTKSEVRSVIVSKLKISTNGVCWDLGCGTGSVSVEIALACSEGIVYSVDKNSEAIELTKSNAVKFKCDNISVIGEDIKSSISELPAPDSVFIGGASGLISDILAIVYSKNIKANVVVSAVSLETLNETVQAFENCGVESEIVQIAVTRTRKIGRHTMMSAENPIFIISSKPREEQSI